MIIIGFLLRGAFVRSVPLCFTIGNIIEKSVGGRMFYFMGFVYPLTADIKQLRSRVLLFFLVAEQEKFRHRHFIWEVLQHGQTDRASAGKRI